MNAFRRRGRSTALWFAGACALPVLVVLVILDAGTADDPPLSVEECQALVTQHSGLAMTEAKRIVGAGAELSYVADCNSYDEGGVEGDVRSSTAEITSRMSKLGAVHSHVDGDCMKYLQPEGESASCSYLEFRPRDSRYVFEIVLPTSTDHEFALKFKR